MNSKLTFSNDFVWGAATAAHQIEGATDIDGRGPCVWDMLSRKRGAVLGAQSASVACDHYNRFPEDIALMRQIGLKAYRFSFSWSRLLPAGVGEVNAVGVDFYDRLIDKLLANGITPYATLFHWDYPYELFLRGGWLNPDSVEWFGEYTSLLASRFSDRVQNWWTLNEPPCFLGLGHIDGIHAPGLKLDWPEFLIATKHALMAHGRSVQVLRSEAKLPPMIGCVPISHVGIPIDESEENIEAARRYTFGVQTADRSFWFARLYLDPILLGTWPEECVRVLTPQPPEVTQDELDLMNQPLDCIGLNFYSAPTIRQGADGEPEVLKMEAGHPRTGFDWPITPDGLYWSARFHHERYQLPIMITENGLSSLDWVSEDGAVHDSQRIDFTSRYLKSLHRAHSEGYPVKGYFHWSLLDNFEWAEGYRHRFGLIHVDFETQKRTLKDSAFWFGRVAAQNGLDGANLNSKAAVVHFEEPVKAL